VAGLEQADPQVLGADLVDRAVHADHRQFAVAVDGHGGPRGARRVLGIGVG
jgi:hypothetical protein